jgi:hypothetical protein
MLNKKSKIYLKDKIRRSISIKYKYLNLIQKSLFHNRYILKKKKLYFFYFINLNKLTLVKKKNICLVSAENKSVNKKLIMTRFQINYSSTLNKLQNFKINSW